DRPPHLDLSVPHARGPRLRRRGRRARCRRCLLDAPSFSRGRMIGALVPAAWAVVVAGAAWRRRPAPKRVRQLLTSRRRRSREVRAGVAERLGCALLRLLGRRPDPETGRRIGLTLLVAAPVVAVVPVAAPAAALM